MKKFLLSFVTLAASGIMYNASAQCDPTVAVKNYIPGPAPITIDGSATDWQTEINGPFSGNHYTPYLSPVAAGNIQIDGLRDSAVSSSNYDRDTPGQDHRDLRFFAFTYDTKNAYFYYRRPDNNTAQVLFIYYIDINADGFMRNGEPVLVVRLNGPNATPEMHYYTSNPLSAGHDATKGDIMVSPVTGFADGYAMPGTVTAVPGASLPALNVAGGEKFAASKTENGYGGEFVVPFNYLRLYGGATGIDPMVYTRIFTWHTSLNNGAQFGTIEDNAGGCCSGTAASGAANLNVVSSTVTAGSTFSSNTTYTLKTKYVEVAGANTNSELATVTFKNTAPGSLSAAYLQGFSVTVYADANNDGTADGAGVSYSYDAILSTTPGEYVYSSGLSSPASVLVNAAGNGSFIVVVNTVTPGIKSFTIETETEDEIVGTNTNECAGANAPGNTVETAFVLTTLPVNFKTFTAARSNATVLLKWETASEENSAGFALERNVNGTWVEFAYVPSQAVNGNSSSALSYQYTDLNDVRGVTQYRVRQVDLNGRASYSVIRAVRGQGQIGKTLVFPNPTSNGKVSVVFEDANSQRNVTLVDMTGRVIKQWRNAINNIQIDNLTPGIYSLRIIIPETGEQSVEKIVVNKR